MKKTLFLWSLLGLLMLNIAWAQQKTIRGTVLDETDTPLPGATVIIDGTTQGVSTDFDGNFSINATFGDVLVASYVGYADQRITLGDQDNLTINLALDNELEEVVVTSLGIRRDTKALGYAVQNVSAETEAKSNATDAISALTGQAAGVQITNVSGSAGAGSKIVIRGANLNFRQQPSTNYC